MYLGMNSLMRLLSRERASISLVTPMVSKSAIWLTMARTLGAWSLPAWKYWLTRFFRLTALPTYMTVPLSSSIL